MKSKIIPITLLSLFLVGCSQSNSKIKNATDQVTDSLTTVHQAEIETLKEELNAQPKFYITSSTDYNINNLEHKGNVVETKTWKDLNGENIVLFCQRTAELFVYHYCINNSEVKLYRKVQDHLYTDYPVVEFLPESINVSDKDGDEIGEITFAYILEDITGVIPDLKLLILENGDKYIIRGNFAGKKNIDKSLKDGPNEFLNEANRVWKKLNDAHPYSY